MDKIYAVSSFLRHKLLGSTSHGVHSPFVYDLLNKVILDETPYYFYEDIESLRSKLLLDERVIEVRDFGTGGQGNSNRKLKISHISKNFLQSKRNAQLISRLVTFFRPVNILEIGSSLGITSLYMAMPNRKCEVITLEGCPQTAAVAKENFIHLGIENINLITGEFDITLPEILKKSDKFDLVYFDGNHTREATLRYFEWCLRKQHSQSLFIFDDIHWSREMSAAWKIILNHPRVTISIDLFQLGLVFFQAGVHKQHFNLKY